MKPVTLELGGKSAMIVFEDADVDIAVTGALMANFFRLGYFIFEILLTNYLRQKAYQIFLSSLENVTSFFFHVISYQKY